MISRSIYSLGIQVFSAVLKIAGVFNEKAQKRAEADNKLFEQLKSHEFKSEEVIWIHAASLGEFEQGRPIIEALRKEHPQYQILLTFFSPSGYEVRKHYEGVDVVTYIPLDKKRLVTKFLDIVQPKKVILVKYEFWSNMILELGKRSVPIYSISSIFRPQQVFFKSYGSFFRETLKRIEHFFVQDAISLELLQSIGIQNASVTGDTRFDRVISISEQKTEIELVESFKGDNKLLVIGSSWPEDLEVILPFINNEPENIRFIIAPHEISEKDLNHIQEKLEVKNELFSKYTGNSSSVLIIDNIGMLSSIYGYADFAFVGGAYGDGLHNTLEAAVYGIPVMFGNRNYRKFNEAVKAVELGGAFTISDSKDFESLMKKFQKEDFYKASCLVNRNFVYENKGATGKIMNKIFKA